jgi:hypothetical protein
MIKNFKIWVLLFIITMLFFPLSTYASDFTDYINKPIQTQETKEGLRIEWQNIFGFDMFKGYFMIKDLENTLREYTTINCAGFRGKLKIADNYRTVEYKFKLEF